MKKKRSLTSGVAGLKGLFVCSSNSLLEYSTPLAGKDNTFLYEPTICRERTFVHGIMTHPSSSQLYSSPPNTLNTAYVLLSFQTRAVSFSKEKKNPNKPRIHLCDYSNTKTLFLMHRSSRFGVRKYIPYQL